MSALYLNDTTSAFPPDSVRTGFGGRYHAVIHFGGQRDSLYFTTENVFISPQSSEPPWWSDPWVAPVSLALLCALAFAALHPGRAVEDTEGMDPLDAEDVIG